MPKFTEGRYQIDTVEVGDKTRVRMLLDTGGSWELMSSATPEEFIRFVSLCEKMRAALTAGQGDGR